MNSYQFWPNDQIWNNWLLSEEFRTEPYVRVKERYREIVCPRCGKLDHDRAFALGFEANIRIRARGEIICTDDEFYCVTERVQRIFEAHNVGGIEVVPLGGNGWYAMNVVLRVKADASVYESSRALCRVCQRPSSLTGVFSHLSQIEAPNRDLVFFTPTFDRSSCAARDIFATEDLVKLLKEGGVKGGCFERLLTAEEEAKIRESAARGKPWWPARTKRRVYL